MAVRMQSGTKGAAKAAKAGSRTMVPGGAIGKVPRGWAEVERGTLLQRMEPMVRPVIKGLKRQVGRGMFTPPADTPKTGKGLKGVGKKK